MCASISDWQWASLVFLWASPLEDIYLAYIYLFSRQSSVLGLVYGAETFPNTDPLVMRLRLSPDPALGPKVKLDPTYLENKFNPLHINK